MQNTLTLNLLQQSSNCSKKSDGKERNEDSFNHRSTIGSLSCLAGCARPDASMAVHQTAKFSNCPKESHNAAVKRIGKHLLDTIEEGLTCSLDVSKGLKVFVDSDFAGVFDKPCAKDPASVHSRTGFVIKRASFPIIWKSKLQSETSLSTTEMEHIALSTALREEIPLMHMLKVISSVMCMRD